MGFMVLPPVVDYFSDSSAGQGWISIGIADEAQDVCTVKQAVHGSAGEQWVTKELVQLIGVSI
jgi:hypothetical protein